MASSYNSCVSVPKSKFYIEQFACLQLKNTNFSLCANMFSEVLQTLTIFPMNAGYSTNMGRKIKMSD